MGGPLVDILLGVLLLVMTGLWWHQRRRRRHDPVGTEARLWRQLLSAAPLRRSLADWHELTASLLPDLRTLVRTDVSYLPVSSQFELSDEQSLIALDSPGALLPGSVLRAHVTTLPSAQAADSGSLALIAGDTVYGVLVIAAPPAALDPRRREVISQLVRTLGRECDRVATSSADATPRRGSSMLLSLLRSTDAHRLEIEIARVIARETNAGALLWITETDSGQLRRMAVGAEPVRLPAVNDLRWLTADLEPGVPHALPDLPGETPEIRRWIDDLHAAELTQAASFPPAPERSGLVVLRTDGDPTAVESVLRQLATEVQAVVENQATVERLQELSITDPLTGLYNKRYFLLRLEEEMVRAERYGRSLSLIIFDLDDLKGINDSHGHLAGDAVLSQLGTMLKQTIRAIDVVARYGGDEFCVIMPEADMATSEGFMQRLGREIAEMDIRLGGGEGSVRTTISLGAAIFPYHAGSAENLIKAADMALYEAKKAGRNDYRLPAEPVD